MFASTNMLCSAISNLPTPSGLSKPVAEIVPDFKMQSVTFERRQGIGSSNYAYRLSSSW